MADPKVDSQPLRALSMRRRKNADDNSTIEAGKTIDHNDERRVDRKSIKSRGDLISIKKNEEKKLVGIPKKEEEQKNTPLRRSHLCDGSWKVSYLIEVEQRQNSKLPPIKRQKENENQNEKKSEEELSDDDGFQSNLVNPNEEYSEKYYDLLRTDLMKEMSEEAADQMMVVHKKTHEKTKRGNQAERLQSIVLGGRYEIQALYDGVYPEYYSMHSKLWICDGCFNYFADKQLYIRHRDSCTLIAHPPGDEVYRDGDVLVFKVSGDQQEEYCNKLSMLAMLWIHDKNVFLDVDEHDFFIVTQFTTKYGMRPVGYFSRQRISTLTQNLACFCVFPCYQKQGFGRFIIDFSYQLSRISSMPGGPEKPLSPFGRISYFQYWKRTVLLKGLTGVDDHTTVDDLVKHLGMLEEDIVEVIEALFSTKISKKRGLVINKAALERWVAAETIRDQGKLYAKIDCFAPEFYEYMRNFKEHMQREELRLMCGLPAREDKKESDMRMEKEKKKLSEGRKEEGGPSEKEKKKKKKGSR